MRYGVMILLCLMTAGCGGSEDAGAGNAAEPVAEVQVAPVVLGESGGAVVAYGVTEAAPGATHALVAPAEAVIAAVLAPTGTAVRAGQAVLTLRPTATTRNDIARADSDARLADAAYRRALRLRADGLNSDAEVEAARAAAQTAGAVRANLAVPAGGLVLRAPAAGTVENLTARPGDQVAGGTALGQIATRGDLRARLSVDPAVAARVRPGQPIALLLPGGGQVAAPVDGIDPQLDPSTRLATVYVRVPDGHFDAGSPVRAQLAVGATASGLTIPYAALLDDGGRSYVYVIRRGVARAVDVSPGSSAGDRVQILGGLAAGDRVVTVGGTALEDGMRVRIGRTGQ